MKTMKRFLAGMVAVASIMAIAPMSAFAADDTKIDQGSTNKTGGMVVSYLKSAVSPTYTITIPATVDLNSATRKAEIKAEGVYLDTTKHKQINVTLDSAQYVETGASTFIAKTADGNSSVTYTIGKDTATTGVKVGDTVAEFTADDSVTLNFSEPTGATYAGKHTETLTFGISVENAVTTRTVTFNTATDGKTINKDGVTCSSGFDTYNNLFGFGSGFSVSSGQFTKIVVTASDTSMTGEDQMTMNTIEGWSTNYSDTATWTGKSSTVPFGVIMGNQNPVTIVFTIEE